MLGTNLCENKIRIFLCGESQFDSKFVTKINSFEKNNGMWLQLQHL